MTSRFLSLILLVLAGTVAVRADDAIRAAQIELRRLGYYNGEIDGGWGSQTAAAVRRYQVAEHLAITGELNPQTRQKLRLPPANFTPSPVRTIFDDGPLAKAKPSARKSAVRLDKEKLTRFHFYAGPINGKPDAALMKAVATWQSTAGLNPSGRLDSQTVKGLGL